MIDGEITTAGPWDPNKYRNFQMVESDLTHLNVIMDTVWINYGFFIFPHEMYPPSTFNLFVTILPMYKNHRVPFRTMVLELKIKV